MARGGGTNMATAVARHCCLDCCEDLFRIIKAFAAFALGTIATSMSFKAKHDVNIAMAQITTHTGVVRFLANFFTLSFGYMYLVNIKSLLYVLLGSSCFRECIWRPRAGQSVKCTLLQCVLGPCSATCLQIEVWLTLGLQLAVSYIYLLSGIALAFLLGVCRAGNATVRAMQKMIDENNADPNHSQWSPTNWFMQLNVRKYCQATSGLDQAAKLCFAGCVLSVLSQVLFIMIISEEKGRIEATMAEDWEGGKKVAVSLKDRAEESTSSSDSDYEADPLVKYQRGRRGNAARPYKVAGRPLRAGARTFA